MIHKTGRAITRRGLLAAAALPLAAPALAQDAFPSRPLRIVVGFTPGGGTDTAVRLFAPRLSAILGQPVVVENRPGAGGNIAMDLVARSPADGYTLLLGTIGTLVINPMVMRMATDPLRDLAPVAIVIELASLLVVPADRPWRSVADLVEAAKVAPGSLSWGHSGIGASQHLSGLMLDRLAGLQTLSVSYRGGGDVAADLLAGRIDYAFGSAPSVMQHVEAGRLRALAVPTARRSRLLPEVPTVAESGVRGFDVGSWFAITAPRGAPQPIVDKLSQAMRTALEDPAVVAALQRNGLEPIPSTPGEFATAWTAERAKWEPMAREGVLGGG